VYINQFLTRWQGKVLQSMQIEEYHTNNIINKEDSIRSGLYAKRQLALVRGKGAVLWDENGKEYIDCSSGRVSMGAGNYDYCSNIIFYSLI